MINPPFGLYLRPGDIRPAGSGAFFHQTVVSISSAAVNLACSSVPQTHYQSRVVSVSISPCLSAYLYSEGDCSRSGSEKGEEKKTEFNDDIFVEIKHHFVQPRSSTDFNCISFVFPNHQSVKNKLLDRLEEAKSQIPRQSLGVPILDTTDVILDSSTIQEVVYNFLQNSPSNIWACVLVSRDLVGRYT